MYNSAKDDMRRGEGWKEGQSKIEDKDNAITICAFQVNHCRSLERHECRLIQHMATEQVTIHAHMFLCFEYIRRKASNAAEAGTSAAVQAGVSGAHMLLLCSFCFESISAIYARQASYHARAHALF